MFDRYLSPLRRFTWCAAFLAASLFAAGCGGGGGGSGSGDAGVGGASSSTDPTSLNQAGYQTGTINYVFGHNSIPNIPFTNAPADTDLTRWAMLHDGVTYRLYFFRQNSMSVYQFGFNGTSYEWGHASIPEIAITGAPAEADPASFAMLHDGTTYRLYMRGRTDKTQLYQFGFNGASYAFGHSSIPVIATTGLPGDADLDRWGMLHDGVTYRQYVGKAGDPASMYQCGFDGSTYAYGHSSIPELNIVGMPSSSDTGSFAMLHDGVDYRFYHLAD